MKGLVVINIALLSGKQEFFQGVHFFLKSFSMGDFGKASPAQGLASKAGSEERRVVKLRHRRVSLEEGSGRLHVRE